MTRGHEQVYSDGLAPEDEGVWVDCWNCDGSGYMYHDCGEDTCCCAEPENNVTCDVCNGEGGWGQ